MIYLITVHDKLKRVAHIDEAADLKTDVWKSILQVTTHKTILYPLKTFNTFHNTAIPNRVNIVFANRSKKSNKLPNVLINNNFKDIINTFQDKDDDLYIIGSTTDIVELFAKDADFIIDFTTQELGHTEQSIFDTINFANYTLLRKEEYPEYVIRYFVREKSNYIGN